MIEAEKILKNKRRRRRSKRMKNLKEQIKANVPYKNR
jgi:hypothetical protein